MLLGYPPAAAAQTSAFVDAFVSLHARGIAALRAWDGGTAVAQLEAAVRALPDSAVLLGLALQRLGRASAAKAQLAEFNRLGIAAFDAQRKKFDSESSQQPAAEPSGGFAR
jgi:hypothetical protein